MAHVGRVPTWAGVSGFLTRSMARAARVAFQACVLRKDIFRFKGAGCTAATMHFGFEWLSRRPTSNLAQTKSSPEGRPLFGAFASMP